MTRLSWLHYPVIALFVGVLLLWFASTLRPMQSSLQYEFDNWLSEQRDSIIALSAFVLEDAGEPGGVSDYAGAGGEEIPPLSGEVLSSGASFGKEASLGRLPTLSARIDLASARNPIVYRVAPSSEVERPQQILRLLDLMKEAGVFDRSRGEGSPEGDEEKIVIRVESAKKIVEDRVSTGDQFETVLTRADIEGNIQLMLLLRLFEQFSEHPPGVPTDMVSALETQGSVVPGSSSHEYGRASGRAIDGSTNEGNVMSDAEPNSEQRHPAQEGMK